MADNDQYNEEYHFSDPDEINPDVIEPDASTDEEVVSERQYTVPGGTNVKRNAIIAVAAFILLFILYSFISRFFRGEEEITPRPQAEPQVLTPAPVRPQPAPTPAPTPAPRPAPTPALGARVEQRLTSLETSHGNLQADVSSVSNQLTALNTTVGELSAKIADLNQVVTDLTTKMAEQSTQIERLVVRAKKPAKPAKIVRKVEAPVIRYYVQAVIPGRAWLIGSNGTTLTVREGTPIPGYGIVKLIDSIQGRVLTSQGKIIHFSQQDS